MILKSYENLSIKEREQFFIFCKNQTEKSKDPAAVNMWGSSTNTLSYLLTKTKRFKEPKGNFYILYDESQIAACGGVYISDFDINIGILGVRSYVIKEYRNNSLIRDYILPACKDWSVTNKLKILSLTFNDYNKNLIEIFKRRRLGDTEKIKTREPKNLFYNNFNEVTFPVVIQNTKQWVVYEVLDSEYYFDWSKIKH